MKRAKEQVRIVERRRLAKGEHSILNQEFRIRKTRTQLLKLMMDGQPRCRNFLQQANADMVHRACVSEINAHPIYGSKSFCANAVGSSGRGGRICDADLSRGQTVLGFPGQGIVVAIAPEMKEQRAGDQSRAARSARAQS